MPRKKNNYSDNRLCSNMGLIPIKINKTIFSDIIKKNKKIFSKFDETNNGVISNCSVLLKCNNSKKKGGRLIETANGYRGALSTYCKFMKIKSQETNDKTIEDFSMQVYLGYLNKIFSAKGIHMTIDDIPQPQRTLYGHIKNREDQQSMDLLHNFFIEEIQSQERIKKCAADGTNTEACERKANDLDPIIIKINYGSREWDIAGVDFDGEPSGIIPIIFDHMGYNKNIVCAYEQGYIDNKDKMLKFIEFQKKYIKYDMTKADKIVINDYTEHHTFTLYSYYISRVANPNWLKKYKESVNNPDVQIDRPHEPFTFGDSFYKQIFALFPEKFRAKISGNFSTIEEYWDLCTKPGTTFVKRSKRHSFSLFDDLTQEQWEDVLKKFINDVNEIILNTPLLTDNIYCYRGSSVHYIKHNDGDFSDQHIKINKNAPEMFLSSRLASYSLNFDKSYEYLMKSNEPHKRCMYRTVITAGTPVLFIPTISDAPDELEILTPINCLIAYRKYENGSAEPFEQNSFNNRHKKYGLCSTEEFNSADIVIYPPKSTNQAQSSDEIELDSNDWEGKIDEFDKNIIIFTRKS
jgi:hypothetical protein